MAVNDTFVMESGAFAVREDLGEAFRRSWAHIAKPGSEWSGAERIAIAEETRNAWDCSLCEERKAALSPYGVDGDHAASEVLPAVAVEAIHRITTDPGRLTEKWFKGLLSGGLTESQYAEIIGIVGTVTSIDTFYRALGMALQPLPDPLQGRATGYRPDRLSSGGSWLPLLMENDLADAERDIYGGLKHGANVLRCMSIVPDEVRNLIQLAEAMYMSDRDVANFKATAGRAITRDQIEMLSSRVSINNECFY